MLPAVAGIRKSPEATNRDDVPFRQDLTYHSKETKPMKSKKWLSVVLIAGCYAAGGVHAVTLQVTDGILTGATGVNVGGKLFDVSFQDGTCAELFSGCDAVDDFMFDDATAFLAVQALLDQVFVDGASGAFDSNPYLTSGCGLGSPSGCNVIVPVGLDANGWARGRLTKNEISDASDSALWQFFRAPDFTTADLPGETWALWTPAPASVPEAPTLVLLSGGLTAMAVVRRRRARVRNRPYEQGLGMTQNHRITGIGRI